MLGLGDFNEPALLHNIRVRFEGQQIYSAIGHPIVISINPYKSLPIYTSEIALKYKESFEYMKSGVIYIFISNF